MLPKRDPVSNLVREIAPNQFLFKEGEVATNAFVIMGGTVKLTREVGGQDYTVASVGKGDVLGEGVLSKANYRHILSAQAVTETKVLEFAPKSGKWIETQIPDFTSRLLAATCERLEAANGLIKILQTDDPSERFIQYLLHFTRYNIKGFPDVSEVPLHPKEICFSAKLELDQVEKCFRFLIDKKTVVKRDGVYFVVDGKELSQKIPDLKAYLSK